MTATVDEQSTQQTPHQQPQTRPQTPAQDGRTLRRLNSYDRAVDALLAWIE